MVREITLFEVHLDGARFGTNDAAGEEIRESADGSGNGPNLGRLVLMSLFLSIAVSVIVRLLLGGEDGDDSQEEPDEPINVEIES